MFKGDPETSWEFALNLSERKRRHGFVTLKPNCAWDLGQSEKKPIYSDLAGPLHCIMKNAGLIFREDLEPPRWMVEAEMAIAMGFPIVPEWAESIGSQCLWTRGVVGYAKRSRHSTVNQIGNAMHVNSIGGVMFTCVYLLGPEHGLDLPKTPNMHHSKRGSSDDEDDGNDDEQKGKTVTMFKPPAALTLSTAKTTAASSSASNGRTRNLKRSNSKGDAADASFMSTMRKIARMKSSPSRGV